MKINKIHVWVIVGLIILNLGLFFVNINDFFVSDDFDWIYNTKNSQHSIGDYFTANYYGEQGVGGSYRPMVNVAFWVNYQVWGLNPLPYHLTNLIFHIGVCFLVYLLVLSLFKDYKDKNKIAILASVFFSILPNHSEAVIWIAAVADPLATFFYLLAFYGYLNFRQKMKFSWLLISVVSFILGLLTKEFVITLPLLIVVWELYEAITRNKFCWQDIVLKGIGYWVLGIGYLFVRYYSIGLAFGYYGREQFQLQWERIFKMFVALITDLIFWGQMRVSVTEFFVANKLLFVMAFILVLGLIWLSLKEYQPEADQPLADKFKAPWLFDCYFIAILPVLFLAFNDLSDEGERYNYLASVFFCILLALLVIKVKKIKVRSAVLAVIILYFSVSLINKNYNWQLASELNKKIVTVDVPQVLDLEKENYFVALPDNFEGAPMLRNGLVLAVKLFNPNWQFKGNVLNAYQRLARENYKDKILYWGPYVTGGYLAETYDHQNWVTGFDRQEAGDYIFELWNYNYANYTSNTIRLIFKDQDGNFIKAGEEPVKVIIFNEGGLQILK